MVALRQQVFRFSERQSPAGLAAYLERIFCRNPWVDHALPSLVYEDAGGRVAGFLGVIVRPMRFQGEPLRAAVATQLMVAPECRGLAGRRLMRTFLTGPQDLSLSDTANEAGRRLWESLGGGTSLIRSLSWTKVLRPCRELAGRLSRPALRAGLFAARPLLAALDAVVARLPAGVAHPPPEGTVEALDAATMAGALPTLVPPRDLRPAYEAGSLGWLLAQAAEKRQFGELRGRLVRDAGGRLAGWFLYYWAARGVGQVLQLAARQSAHGLVLRHLFFDAWRRGLTALTGPLEPALIDHVADQRFRLAREGPWMLVHSRRPELVRAIERGDAFLSRLEGEWWLSC